MQLVTGYSFTPSHSHVNYLAVKLIGDVAVLLLGLRDFLKSSRS